MGFLTHLQAGISEGYLRKKSCFSNVFLRFFFTFTWKTFNCYISKPLLFIKDVVLCEQRVLKAWGDQQLCSYWSWSHCVYFDHGHNWVRVYDPRKVKSRWRSSTDLFLSSAKVSNLLQRLGFIHLKRNWRNFDAKKKKRKEKPCDFYLSSLM